jgi:trimeric autotransporter adhesin
VHKLRLSYGILGLPLFFLFLGAPQVGFGQPDFTVPFTYQVGGTLPVAYTHTIGDPAGVAVSLSSGIPSWLSATLSRPSVPTTLTLALVPAGLASLAAGTYTTTVTVNSDIGSLSWGVTLTVTSGTALPLTLSSTALSFNAAPGGAPPASQTLTVTAQSSVSASAQPLEQSCLATNWLTLSPTGNITASPANTNLTVSVDQTGIAAGTTCTGSISLTTDSATQTVTVTLTVGGPLTISPSTLTFSGTAGGTAPASQTLTVSAASSVNATAQASEQTCTSSNWLTLSPTGSFVASATAATFTVSVNQSGIAAGITCSGTISMVANSITETVNVSLDVTSAASATLTVIPSALTFNYVTGGTAPSAQAVTVTAQSNTNVTAQASEQSCTTAIWLAVIPSGSFVAGPTNTNLLVSINPAGIAAGSTCNGAISLSTASGTQTVPVTLNVTAPPSAQLSLSVSAFSFTAVENAVPPAAQTLSVTALSSTTATAQISEKSCTTSNWLFIQPTGSFTASPTSTNFAVSVNQVGIAAGTVCNGSILMIANSFTQTVGVTMVVGSASSGGSISVNPSGPFSFSYTRGGANPLPQSVSVSSVTQGLAAINFTVATSANWILTNAGSSIVATPYPLQIGVDPTTLAASTTPYSGTVTITPTGGTPIVINLTLTVAGTPAITATPTTMTFNYALGGTSPATQIVQVSGAGSAGTFSVATSSSGWLQVSPACTVGAPCTTPNTGTFSLAVTADPTVPNAGTNFGTITIAGTGQTAGSSIVNVSFTLTAPLPSISLVTNAASFATGPVSPGEIISIFANPSTPIGPQTAMKLSNTTCPAPCTDVPTTMGGVQVIFQPGGVAAPLTYVSATQINCVVPYELLGSGSGNVLVKYLGQASTAYPLQYTSTQPGIFTALGTGTGLATVLQYDAQGNYQGQNSSSSPASAGWYLVLYVTGEGMISSPAVTGRVTTITTSVPLLGPPKVVIDNLPSTVPYFAEADGFVSGLMQVNVIVPAGVHPGQTVPLSLSMNGNSSQSGVVIYIK